MRYLTSSNASNFLKSNANERGFTQFNCFTDTTLTLIFIKFPRIVYLYENQLQININVSSFFDDKNCARHPMVISNKIYDYVANLLY